MEPILVINPNSSEDVTAAIDRSLDGLRTSLAIDVQCRTLAEGPPGIESQADVESVVQPTAQLIASEPAGAYVIACFSDPGLFLARELTPRPVLGIAESAFHLAIGLGGRFGIVAILKGSIPRHVRHVRALGYEDSLAGDRALGIGVAGLKDRAAVIDQLIAVGTALRDDDGADVVILGCAGMGQYRAELEQHLGVPVIDPCLAAVARAAGLIALGYRLA